MSKKNVNPSVVYLDEDLVRIRPNLPLDAIEDPTLALIDPVQAALHGIDLDDQGFPTLSSLEAWHRKNNPHLFLDEVSS